MHWSMCNTSASMHEACTNMYLACTRQVRTLAQHAICRTGWSCHACTSQTHAIDMHKRGMTYARVRRTTCLARLVRIRAVSRDLYFFKATSCISTDLSWTVEHLFHKPRAYVTQDEDAFANHIGDHNNGDAIWEGSVSGRFLAIAEPA